MWFPSLITALLACAQPDADALLQSGRVAEAAAAWKDQTGRTVDFGHPAADGLARRAALQHAGTMADVERQMRPVLLLDQTPLRGRLALDLSFPSLGPVLAAAFDLGGTLVAVGRSQNPAERGVDTGGDLPWSNGRLVGGAEDPAAARALGARVDAEPPPRLVTVGMTDGSAAVFFTMQRSGDSWLTVASLTPEPAATWINFADFAAHQGVDAARARYGARLTVPERPVPIPR